MHTRSQRSLQERNARSKLLQQIGELPMCKGSLQREARVCGKPTCHCRNGEKHVSLYLVTHLDGRQKRIYIPWEMEDDVRQAVQNWRQVQQLLNTVSHHQLQTLLKQKEPLLKRNQKKTNTQAKKKTQAKTKTSRKSSA